MTASVAADLAILSLCVTDDRPMKRLVPRFDQESRPIWASDSCQSERASTRDSNVMPLGEAGGEGKGFANIGLFDVGEIGKQLFDCASRSKGLDDHSNSDTHPTDAGLPAHNFGIDGDSLKLLHIVNDSVLACWPGMEAA